MSDIFDDDPSAEQLLLRLVNALPLREYWFTDQIAKAVGYKLSSVQRIVKQKRLGKLMQGERRGRGFYVIQRDDLPALCAALCSPTSRAARKRKRRP